MSIARAVYAKPDLAILDDPMSALDAGTAKNVFERLLKSPDPDLLGTAAIVLVTHASHLLHRVDRILVLVDGRSAFLGSWNELGSYRSDKAADQAAIDAIKSSIQEDADHEPVVIDRGGAMTSESLRVDGLDAIHRAAVTMVAEEPTEGDGTRSHPRKIPPGADYGKLMSKERREHGLSSLRTWMLWFRHAGGWMYVGVLVVSLGIDRTAYVATEWWLARWTQAAAAPVDVFGQEFSSQAEGSGAQYQYLKVYAMILAVSFVAAGQRSVWAVRGGLLSARALFYGMTKRVLMSPLTFFEVDTSFCSRHTLLFCISFEHALRSFRGGARLHRWAES